MPGEIPLLVFLIVPIIVWTFFAVTSFVYLIWNKFKSSILAVVRKFEIVVVDVTPRDSTRCYERSSVDRAQDGGTVEEDSQDGRDGETVVGTDGRLKRWFRSLGVKGKGNKTRPPPVKDEGRVGILDEMERGVVTTSLEVDGSNEGRVDVLDAMERDVLAAPPPPPLSRIPTLSLPKKLFLWAFDGDPLYIHAVQLASPSSNAGNKPGRAEDERGNPQLEDEEIENDPRNINFEGTCSVCLDDFSRGDLVTVSSAHISEEAAGCNHVFHLSCYEAWVKEPAGVNCPVCRRRYVGRRKKRGRGCRRRSAGGGRGGDENEGAAAAAAAAEQTQEAQPQSPSSQPQSPSSQPPSQSTMGLARELDVLDEIRASTETPQA
ncbi:hypothetical protein TrCOL_g1000 [Triparma columacea]|uniref:RING-type domain-containing protein n=1 Tax=Triparma columacea TaxID=722753 RepID=A0A9W7L0M9_9STRA|nr:hypothetical protein TrCOL_g1000 [Triparma columacea]